MTQRTYEIGLAERGNLKVFTSLSILAINFDRALIRAKKEIEKLKSQEVWVEILYISRGIDIN
jgi:hypothetical protein